MLFCQLIQQLVCCQSTEYFDINWYKSESNLHFTCNKWRHLITDIWKKMNKKNSKIKEQNFTKTELYFTQEC